MGVLTPAALRARIAAGDLDPVYLLLGDDEQEKRELTAALAGTIDEGLRPFNLDRFHGGDAGLDAVLAAARMMPVMTPRRIVVAVRAERMLQPAQESAAARRSLDALADYLQAPPAETTLVFVAEGLDTRRRIAKQLRARATVVGCGAPEDAAGVRDWIRRRVAAAGRRAEPAAVRLLGDLAGGDVRRLRDAVDRLLLFADAGAAVTEADVREVCGPSAPRPTDDWAVADAIQQGAAGRALRELGLALDGGAVPHMILGQLGWVARARLTGARVAPAIEAVFRTDLALKQSGGEPRVLLERLVAELCGTAAAGGARRRA